MGDESILCGKRILAVDDEPDVLETLQELLGDFRGLVLDTAASYQKGYQLLRSWTYDLVILDIMGVRGFDLLNAAAQLGFPAVMLTAHALTPEALRKSIELGARAFIPKEKMHQIVPFLEDVLALHPEAAWKRLFQRLEGFFGDSFGSRWQQKEQEFWDRAASGKPLSGPAILKK